MSHTTLNFKFVSLLILSLAFASCSEESDVPSPFGYNPKMQPLLDQTELAAQNFLISTEKDTTLVGAKGTIISIPEDCFEGDAENG